MISYESLSRALREDPFEFFVGLGSRRGLKLESCFGLCWLPDLVNDGACLRLDMRFFRLGSEAAKHEVQSSGGLIITEVW